MENFDKSNNGMPPEESKLFTLFLYVIITLWCNNMNKNENTNERTLVDEDDLEDFLDDFIAEMPLEVLQEVRRQDIASGEDTEIIDKAIAERKRRDFDIYLEEEKERKQQEAEDRKWKKMNRRSKLIGFIFGLSIGKKKK